MLTVLYLVGRDAPTSVPLEVANFIRDKRVRFVVAAFYGEDNGKEDREPEYPFVHIRSQGSLDVSGIRALGNCIRQYRPDVIHVHHTASAFWGALLGKTLTGASIVRSEHNNHQHHTTAQNIINWASQLFSDRVLCNSQDTYRNLHPWEKWAVGDEWEKVYNGIDVDRIDRASQSGTPLKLKRDANEIVVGSVGRLIPQKNYERLIQAFSTVVAAEPSAKLVLVGDGKKRLQLTELVQELDLSDHITFLGEVSRDQVYALLHEFDILVIPSLWEGFCNAAVEAMAAELPLVCSDIRTLHEVVGDVATYVDPESPDSIARGILDLIQEGPVQWRERGQACRKRAVERYSIERTARAYVRNYYIAAGKSLPEELKVA